jgi:hypothetical protein
MNNDFLSDPALTRNLSRRYLPGSLGDLIARADGDPIYCTASGSVRRALVGIVIETFRRDFPDTTFINSLAHYRHADDRRTRWSAEVKGCGAGIVVTRAEALPKGADVFAGLAGAHVINVWEVLEIDYLARLGRPVAWHAVVFPAAYWMSRFAIEAFEWVQASRWAQLFPAADAEIFRPAIAPSPLMP